MASSGVNILSSNQAISPNSNEITSPIGAKDISPISARVTSPIGHSVTKPVTYSNISGYYPNLTMTVEKRRFDNAYDNSIKLSDGSALVRPSICGSITTITPNDDDTYTVKTQPTKMGAKATFKTITEEELIADKSLCVGLLYKNDDGTYDFTYEYKDNNVSEWIPVVLTGLEKQDIINTMKQKFMHF